MTTKARKRSYGAVEALSRLAQYARTNAGDLRTLGRPQQAKAMLEAAEYLESLVLVLRADGQGLPVQNALFE